MKFELTLNGRKLVLNLDGEETSGPDLVLLDQDDDLIAGRDWYSDGYTLAPFLTEELFCQLRNGIEQMMLGILTDIGVPELDDFRMERYHNSFGDEGPQHADFVARIRGCHAPELFPIDIGHVEERVSQVCGVPLSTWNPHDRRSEFCIRVIRPGSPDHNPLHRDVWLESLRDAVNIYVPLAGSTELSALALVPGSHRWKESEIWRTASGALVNGRSFTVPAVTRTSRPLHAVRPNPGPNELLVFSPYLVHGSGANFNTDSTRVSLEMRFWRRN